MSWAVFLRGVNVGGKTFRPSLLPAQLPDLGLQSLGAAGTFAASSGASADAVRRTIRGALPFAADVIVVPGQDLRRLVQKAPHGPEPSGSRRYLTVASAPFPRGARLPICVPDTPEWAVRIEALDGPYALGHYRRISDRVIYPNEVIEKRFGVRATTRWWETVAALADRLAEPARQAPRPRGPPPVNRTRRETPKSRTR